MSSLSFVTLYYAILSRNYIKLPMRSSKIGTALLWMILGTSWPSGGPHWAVRYCRSTRRCCQKVPGSLAAALSVWNVYGERYRRVRLWPRDVLVQLSDSLCFATQKDRFLFEWADLYCMYFHLLCISWRQRSNALCSHWRGFKTCVLCHALLLPLL